MIPARDQQQPQPPNIWVAFDLETTGLDPATDRIIEIGAICFDSAGAELDCFESLINPRRPVSPSAFAVHRIASSSLDVSPLIEDVLPRFLLWLLRQESAGMVAHNARFDAAFLGHEIRRLGQTPPPVAVFDTLDLARRRCPGSPNYRLDTLARRLGLPEDHHHRALADCRRVKDLWLLLDGPRHWSFSYNVECREESSQTPVGWERLARAIELGWLVRMQYSGGTRGLEPRNITPRRLLHMGGVAYVVGQCHVSGFEKKFRLDRIVGYELIAPTSLHTDPGSTKV